MNKTPSFISKETRFQGKYSKLLLNTIYQAYKPYFFKTIALIALGFMGRIFLLSNANIIGIWVDSFCKPNIEKICKSVPYLFSNFNNHTFILTLVTITLIGFLLTVLFRVLISRISALAVSQVYDETTLRTSRLPMSFFDQNPAGRVITRFSNDYNNVFRVFGGPLAEFMTLVFDLIAMTVLIAIASPWFLIIWILNAGINFWIYRLFLPKLRKARRETALKRSPGIAHFAETIGGAATIRTYSKSDTFKKRFSELNDNYLHQRLDTTGIFAKFSLSMGITTAFMFLVIGYFGLFFSNSNSISVGSIGVAFAYIGLSSHVLISFFEWLGQFEEAMTGLERMNEYLRSPVETGAKLPATAQFETGHPQYSAALPDTFAHLNSASIEISNLSMRYKSDLPLVLKNLNLKIRSGERVAIVGKTGSGKSSLIQSFFRLYPLDSGSVRINGWEADCGNGGMDLETYRGLIGYITQDSNLFIGSLRYNLDPSNRHPDTELIESLKKVQFLPLTNSDQEYLKILDYKVEERGRNLSQGERQLICFARCLLHDAPVVIFDEATSSIDPRTEEIVTLATEKFFKGKTQIIIAHRLSTIRNCDRVIWLHQGQIHKEGPPQVILPEFQTANLDII